MSNEIEQIEAMIAKREASVVTIQDEIADLTKMGNRLTGDAPKVKGYAYSETKKNGAVYYYNESGNLHRTDGPAIERVNGEKQWWFNGVHHRIDGPAVEYASGNVEFWIDGISYFKNGFKSEVKRRKAEGTL